MKKLLLILVGLIIAVQAYSSPDNNLIISNGGLRFEVEGQSAGGNFFNGRRIINIPKVDAKYYMPRAIQIKTKSHLTKVKDVIAELTPMIQSSTQDLSLNKVRALYPKYSESNLLSADKNGIGRIYELTYTNPIDPYDACRELMNNPDIEYATPVFIYYSFFTPNDPNIANQYHLPSIKASDAWDISLGNPNVKIAIVDSGVDYTHPDLADNLAEGGYDFVGNISSNDAMSNNFKEDSDPKPSNSSNYHGTHVTGCANAVTNNGIGIAAIAANCKFIPIKCGADNGNIPGIFRGYEAIIYAAELGADIINCSWGGPGYSPAGEDAINQAIALGSVVVVASGNEGLNIDYDDSYPANYENVICVGATTSSDVVPSFSNYGHKVTVYAPGQSVYSTRNPSSYSNETGTSMSSPIVAGIAALVKSVFPDYTPKQIYHQIRSTSDNVLATSAKRPEYYGRANAYNAIKFNNPNFPNNKIPGCDVAEYKIGDADAFINYSEQTLKLNIQNYLSPTSTNFKVKFASLDNFLTIKSNQSSIGILNTLGSKEISLNVQITRNNVWFNGYANLLVTFEDGNYVDYRLLKLPIKMNTDNAYILHNQIPTNANVTLSSSSSPSKSVLWAVGSLYGYYGALYLQKDSYKNLSMVSTDKISSVFAFDGDRAYIGQNTSNGNPKISYTSNSGGNWSDKSVSNIASKITNIHFFNSNDGIFVGNQLNSKWGVGITNNGGSSWTQVMSVPSPQTNEENYSGAIAASGNNFWFASNQGRVYSSTNKGQTWNVSYVSNDPILSLAFANKDSGLVIYNNTNKQKIVGRTTNGGTSWTTGVFNFNSLNVQPVSLFAPKDKNVIIAICKNGEIFVTFDLGSSWTPILSKYTSSVASSAAYHSGNDVRLWLAGSSIASLDFSIPLANAKKMLSFVSQATVNYGDVNIGSSKIDRINLENKGNTKTYIERIYFTGDDAESFQTTVGTASVVEPGVAASARVRFTPTKEGMHTAKMVIESDAEPFNIEIELQGNGVKVSKSSFTTNGVNEVVFDTIYVNSYNLKTLNVTNDGDFPLKLAGTITNIKGVFFVYNVPEILQPSETAEIGLMFAPSVTGDCSAELRLVDTLSNFEQTIMLTGYSLNLASVERDFRIKDVYPNPAQDIAYCYVNFNKDCEIKASLLDITGKVIDIVYNGLAYSGENIILVPVDQLASGTYILVINNGVESVSHKLIVK